MDIVFGADVSHHKPGFDFARAAREGLVFILLKATEGATFVDALFAAYLKAARAAGLLVIAYHYQLANSSAAAQVELILRTVPADVPLAIDVERNSGNIALTRDIVDRLQRAGRRVVWSYIPRWYWQQIGSPSLAGLPPLWSSRYPDTIVGSIADEWADVPSSYWDGYGGNTVGLLQFTSSAAISNYSAGSIDANAFRGTRAQLAALLGGQEEDDMFTEEDRRRLYNADRINTALLADEDTVTAILLSDGKTFKDFDLALVKRVRALEGRPAADVDEAALADELAARGVRGVTAAELIEILSTVRLAPAQPTGGA